MSDYFKSNSVLGRIFKSLRPYHTNKGEGEGVSEIAAVGYDFFQNTIYSLTVEKKSLYQEYKEMGMFPEVAEAVDEIVFEAISPNKEGQILSLNIIDQNLAENENITKNLQKEFDYVINKILDFNTNAEDLFRKFYVEGELVAEILINKENKAKGVIGIQYLPAYTIQVLYDERQNPVQYKQCLTDMMLSQQVREKLKHNEIVFEPAQIAYINSGLVDYQKNLVYSYLERAKVAYRQLKWMENSLLIYRVTRAPERRVFYIDVGKLPKQKADEHIKALITRFKNKKVYNPQTGEVDVGKEVMAMTEDFYFPQRSDGTGSRVETLAGGQNLGEISDILYFLKKLYKALKIPQTRLLEDNMYNPGRMGEITRDEIKFSKWVNKIRGRFVDFIYQVYFTHLQLKGLYSQYKLDKDKISINFEDDNAWKELKALELMRARIDIVNDLYAMKEDAFPIEWIYRQVMNLSDDEIADIRKMLSTQTVSSGEGPGPGGGGGAPLSGKEPLPGEEGEEGEEGGEGETPEEKPEVSKLLAGEPGKKISI